MSLRAVVNCKPHVSKHFRTLLGLLHAYVHVRACGECFNGGGGGRCYENKHSYARASRTNTRQSLACPVTFSYRHSPPPNARHALLCFGFRLVFNVLILQVISFCTPVGDASSVSTFSHGVTALVSNRLDWLICHSR